MWYKTLGMNKSKKISDWLDSHIYFSINGMCTKIGVDTSNFMKYKNAGKIPEKFIAKIETILKDYGYKN